MITCLMKTLMTFMCFFLLSSFVLAQDYYPLKPSKLYYKITPVFAGEGPSLAMTEIVEETATENGVTYPYQVKSYLLKEDGATSSPVATAYARKDASGAILGYSEFSQKEEVVFPAGTLKLGDSWDMSTGKAAVTSLSGTINTPEGDLTDCLVIKVTATEASMISYYQKGIGLVAIVVVAGGEERLMQYLTKAP